MPFKNYGNFDPFLRQAITYPSKKSVTEKFEKAQTMNNFFATVGENLANDIPSTSNNANIYRVTPILSEIQPDISKFEKSFSSAVKEGKSCGPDNITPKDLKLHKPTTVSSLFKVFCKSIEYGSFPQSWKTAKVSCLYKNKGSKKDCGNYRPISYYQYQAKS